MKPLAVRNLIFADLFLPGASPLSDGWSLDAVRLTPHAVTHRNRHVAEKTSVVPSLTPQARPIIKGAPYMSVEFLITALIIVVSPGTGAVYTVGTGLTRGLRMSTVAAFGCTLGIVPHLAAAVAGLAAILHTSALAFESFKWAGVAYLLFLAWQTLREKGAMKIDTEGEDQTKDGSAVRVIWTAVLINFLNPKLSMFFLAFLPQFVPANSTNSLPHMLQLSAVFMIMTFVVFVIYGGFASAVRDHVISRPKVLAWMRRTFAVAFLGLGIQLALASR